MKSARFDLAVVGAGPGGAACALAAARAGLAVVVFDPGASADKPCGEGILPPGVRALRELGLDDALAAGFAFDEIRYVAPSAPPLALRMSEPSVAIPRPALAGAFERALRGEPRVTFVEAFARAERDSDGFEIHAGEERFQARALALANGGFGRGFESRRSSARFAERIAFGSRLGLRLRARFAEPLDAVEVHIGSGGPEVYLTPLPGGVVNIAVLFARAPRDVHGSGALLEHALDFHPAVRERLGEVVTAPACRRLGAPARRAAGPALFAVGDAGGGVDPLLGCGVSIALATGVLAASGAAALVEGASTRAVEREYARAYLRETRARRWLAAFLHAVSSRRSSARAALALGRRAPSWTRALIAIAAGSSAESDGDRRVRVTPRASSRAR